MAFTPSSIGLEKPNLVNGIIQYINEPRRLAESAHTASDRMAPAQTNIRTATQRVPPTVRQVASPDAHSRSFDSPAASGGRDSLIGGGRLFCRLAHSPAAGILPRAPQPLQGPARRSRCLRGKRFGRRRHGRGRVPAPALGSRFRQWLLGGLQNAVGEFNDMALMNQPVQIRDDGGLFRCGAGRSPAAGAAGASPPAAAAGGGRG